MADRWLAAEDLRTALIAAGLASPPDLMALAGDPASTSVRTQVSLPIEGTSGAFFLKAYRYPTWQRSKGLLGRGTLWGRAPELQEFEGLTWLQAHAVPAVRPIAAASMARGGRLRGHALLTEWVPGARDLASCAADSTHAYAAEAPLRAHVARLLGVLVGRMHRLGFRHRDLHPRNVLLRHRAGEVELWLLDCRRGGLGGMRRGPAFDVACLLGRGPRGSRVARDAGVVEPAPFLAAYRDARA